MATEKVVAEAKKVTEEKAVVEVRWVAEPRLDVMWEGTLCLEKTWMTKSLASLAEVIVSCVGMKMLCFDS